MGSHPGRTTLDRDQLIEDHLPLARKLARRYVGRGEPLDDLVQVGALGLLRASERFDPDRGVSFGTFAAVVIDGEIRRHLRASANGRVLAPDKPADEPHDSEPLAASEARALVAGSLRTLDERERRIVLLRFHADMTERQIASSLRISQAQVSRILSQALEKLRTELSRPADASAGGDTAASGEISAADMRAGRESAPTARTPARRRANTRRSETVDARPGGYSGRFLVRMPGELHEQLARSAQEANVSLNRLVNDVLAASTSQTAPEPAAEPAPELDAVTEPQAVPQPELAPQPLPLREPQPQAQVDAPPRSMSRTLRLAVAANVGLIILTGAVAVILLVAALHRGI